MKVAAILEFLDTPASASWSMTPEEAVQFFQAKGLKESFDYRDVIGTEHARAFTVAKMMDTDLLADVQASLDNALATGVPFKEWQQTITPMLQAKGWWGRKQVTDPLTGETIVAGLGSPARLATIYRTNMQSAYAAGAWDAIIENQDEAPFLLYDAIDDTRTRPEHAAWDGTILPVTDAWWHTHYPPNGWNCRCSVIQLSEEELADLGLAPNAKAPSWGTYEWTNPRTGAKRQIPAGLDPGWDFNVGQARQKQLAKTVKDKLAGYPDDLASAADKGLAAAAAEAKATLAAQVAEVQKALAGELGQEAAARGAMKVAERSAAWQVQEALHSKAPYLAKSIKDLQKTKAGAAMKPQQLLAAAKEQAAKLQQQTLLSDWKKAYSAGKTPSAKAQAAFEALPPDAASALVAQLDQAIAANALEAKAGAELAAIATKGGATLEAKALAKVQALLGVDAKATDVLAAVQADVAAAKATQVAGQLKAGLKKALVAEKLPTPAQMDLLKSLPPDQLDTFLKDVEAAKLKAKAAEPTPEWAKALLGEGEAGETITAPAPLNADKLVQIGPQRGSNPGGLYQDTETGATWYIKTPPSVEHARNEVLAARLYQLAGADVPELRLTTLNGQPAVASRIVDDLTKAGSPAALAKTAGAREFFAVDAWLANWDVAGATFDNLLVKGGKAFRVDTGGALRFRAQGGMKGQAWGDTVAELDSLRNAGTNAQTAKVFGGMTKAELQDSGRRLLSIDRAQVDRLVDEFGPADLAERQALKATLRARLDSIQRQLDLEPTPVAAPPAPALREGGKRITAVDFDRITESRANGYTISTDGGDIEDHQVLLQHYTGADGKARTRLVAKLRGDGAKRAEAKLAPRTGEGTNIDLAAVRDAGLALAKSINSRAAKGAAWDTTIETRLEAWKVARLAVLARSEALDLDAHASMKALSQVADTITAWRKANQGSIGSPLTPIAKLDLSALADVRLAPKATATATDGMAWSRETSFSYKLASFERGHMRETATTEHLPAVREVLVGEGDGRRVRFVTDEAGKNSISSRGLVHIDVDGADLAAAERALDTLADLGVVTTRTTQGQRLGLYLDKVANLRTLRNKTLAAKYEATEAIGEEAARNAAKLKLLSDDAGYDLTRSPHWNPEGTYQAFGHGRTLQMRPDLDTPAMEAFEKETLVYTNVTGLSIGAGSDQWNRLLRAIDGGGNLSSQMERARRGIASQGSSVSSDHQVGGANYVFTRLVGKRTQAAGVYFKPRVLRRIDAFSYSGDRYGNVSRETQVADRAIDAEGFTRNRSNSHGNETNFRDGLSLFDDLERIIFSSETERATALRDMRARGYTTWPDGRALEDVLRTK